jgi:hypothetical protein
VEGTSPGRGVLNAVVCSRVYQLQEALSAGTIALEISSRNARVAALQKRWDRLRARLDLILQQRGADVADLPGGASGLLARGYKGREADKLVTRIDPSAGRRSPRPRAPGRRGSGTVEGPRRGVTLAASPRLRRRVVGRGKRSGGSPWKTTRLHTKPSAAGADPWLKDIHDELKPLSRSSVLRCQLRYNPRPDGSKGDFILRKSGNS